MRRRKTTGRRRRKIGKTRKDRKDNLIMNERELGGEGGRRRGGSEPRGQG